MSTVVPQTKRGYLYRLGDTTSFFLALVYSSVLRLFYFIFILYYFNFKKQKQRERVYAAPRLCFSFHFKVLEVHQKKVGFRRAVTYLSFFIKSILIFLPCFLFKKRKGINAVVYICMIFPSEFRDSKSHSEFDCQNYLIVTGLSFCSDRYCLELSDG